MLNYINILLIYYFLQSWREDLKGLKHSVSNKAEVIMHYHRQNTESVRTVVNDAMNQMGEIVQVL